MGRTALCALAALFVVACGGGPATTVNEQQEQGPSSSNSPPTITGAPSTAARAGTSYSFTPAAADRNGDTLSFEIFGRPNWATFNSATGQLIGTPGDADVGLSGAIEIAVSDGKSQSSLASFRIQVSARGSGGNGSALINWTPPTTNTDGSALTELAGYRIRYGTSADRLDSLLEVPSVGVSSGLVEGLSAGTWFFAVIAYSSAGVESPPANTATKTIQ